MRVTVCCKLRPCSRPLHKWSQGRCFVAILLYCFFALGRTGEASPSVINAELPEKNGLAPVDESPSSKSASHTPASTRGSWPVVEAPATPSRESIGTGDGHQAQSSPSPTSPSSSPQASPPAPAPASLTNSRLSTNRASFWSTREPSSSPPQPPPLDKRPEMRPLSATPTSEQSEESLPDDDGSVQSAQSLRSPTSPYDGRARQRAAQSRNRRRVGGSRAGPGGDQPRRPRRQRSPPASDPEPGSSPRARREPAARSPGSDRTPPSRRRAQSPPEDGPSPREKEQEYRRAPSGSAKSPSECTEEGGCADESKPQHPHANNRSPFAAPSPPLPPWGLAPPPAPRRQTRGRERETRTQPRERSSRREGRGRSAPKDGASKESREGGSSRVGRERGSLRQGRDRDREAWFDRREREMSREGKEREEWAEDEYLYNDEDDRYPSRASQRRRRRGYPALSSVERSSFLLSDSQAALDQLARVQQASPASPEESPEESLHELLLRHFLHLPANQSEEEAEAEAKAAEEAAEEKTWVYANLLRHMHGVPTQEKPADLNAASPGASPASPEEDDIYARIVRHFHHQPQKDDNSTEEDDGEEGPVHPHIYLWRYFHGFPPAPEASPGSSPQSPTEPMHPHVYFWRYFHGPPLDGNDSLGISKTTTNAIEVDSVDPDTYPQGQLVEPFPDPTNSRREQEGAVHPHARYLRPPPGRYNEEDYDRRRPRAGRRGDSSREEFYRDEFYRDEILRDEAFRAGGEAYRDEAPRPRPPRGRSREARREASEARVLSVLAEARVQDQFLRTGGLSTDDDDPMDRASGDRQLSAQQAPGPVKTTQASPSPPVSGGERHLQSIFTTGVSALHDMAGINATALQERLRNLHERTVNGTAWGLNRLRRAFGWGLGEAGSQRRFVILLYVPLPILRQYLHLGLRIPRLLWFAPAAATAASAEGLRSRFLAEAVRTCIQNAPTTTLQMACRQIHALVVNGNEGGELPGGSRRRSLRRTMLGMDEETSLGRGPESLHRLLGSMKQEPGRSGGGATWSEEMLEEGGVWGEAYWEWPGADEDQGTAGAQGEGTDRLASARRAPPPLALADE